MNCNVSCDNVRNLEQLNSLGVKMHTIQKTPDLPSMWYASIYNNPGKNTRRSNCPGIAIQVIILSSNIFNSSRWTILKPIANPITNMTAV